MVDPVFNGNESQEPKKRSMSGNPTINPKGARTEAGTRSAGERSPSARWTHAEIEEAARLSGSGKSPEEIEEAMGIPARKVEAKLRRLGRLGGAPKRRSPNAYAQTDWTDERVRTLSDLWGKGERATDIAAALGGGISKSAVIGKLTRMGLAGHGSRAEAGRMGGRPSHKRENVG